MEKLRATQRKTSHPESLARLTDCCVCTTITSIYEKRHCRTNSHRAVNLIPTDITTVSGHFGLLSTWAGGKQTPFLTLKHLNRHQHLLILYLHSHLQPRVPTRRARSTPKPEQYGFSRRKRHLKHKRNHSHNYHPPIHHYLSRQPPNHSRQHPTPPPENAHQTASPKTPFHPLPTTPSFPAPHGLYHKSASCPPFPAPCRQPPKYPQPRQTVNPKPAHPPAAIGSTPVNRNSSTPSCASRPPPTLKTS